MQSSVSFEDDVSSLESCWLPGGFPPLVIHLLPLFPSLSRPARLVSSSSVNVMSDNEDSASLPVDVQGIKHQRVSLLNHLDNLLL